MVKQNKENERRRQLVDGSLMVHTVPTNNKHQKIRKNRTTSILNCQKAFTLNNNGILESVTNSQVTILLLLLLLLSTYTYSSFPLNRTLFFLYNLLHFLNFLRLPSKHDTVKEMAASDGSEYFELGSLHSESFAMASNSETVAEDEEELQWAALSRLPSQKRINYALLRASSSRAQLPTQDLVDVRKLSRSRRELVVKKALATTDQDNYRLLCAIKERFDRFHYLILVFFFLFCFPCQRFFKITNL